MICIGKNRNLLEALELMVREKYPDKLTTPELITLALRYEKTLKKYYSKKQT